MSTRLTLTLALLLTAPAFAQTPAAPAGTIEYYHVDALGSVRAVTDASGAVVRSYHYHPFGEGVGVEAGTDPMRFTGKPRDGETGLDYFGARYYAPRVGRFTTVDPVYTWQENLVDPQRWNRYAYVRNSSLRYRDPDGRIIETLWDIANITLSAKSVWDNPTSLSNWGALIFDVGAAVLPGLPAFGGTLRVAGAADNVADARRFSTYGDITTGRSIPNRVTDVSSSDLIRELGSAGFSKATSRDGKVQILSKDGLTYTIREHSRAGHPTAEVLKDGKLVLKIRLTGGTK